MSGAAVPQLILEARAALEEHGEAIAPLFTMPGELDAHRRALGRSDEDLADRVVLAIARRSAEHVLDAVRRAKRAARLPISTRSRSLNHPDEPGPEAA